MKYRITRETRNSIPQYELRYLYLDTDTWLFVGLFNSLIEAKDRLNQLKIEAKEKLKDGIVYEEEV